MSRPLRIEYPNAWYHVMNRGRRREEIYFTDADRDFFMKLLGKCVTLYKLEVHAYTLMPNHYHLLLRTPLANISRVMRHLNGLYTQYINQRYDLEGSVFKGRYKSILVEEEKYMLECVRYIHRNPYKAKLEQRIGDDVWTSHCAYVQKKYRPKWLTVTGVLERFSNYEREAIKKLDAFVKEQPDRDFEERLDSVKWPSVLGGDGFKEMSKRVVLGKKLDFGEIPQYKEYVNKLNARDVLKLISEKSGMSEAEILRKRVRETIKEKRAFVYLSRNVYQLKVDDVLEVLGCKSRATVGKIHKHAIEDVSKRKGCYKLLKSIAKL